MLVSRTVTDLVAGSGFEFEDKGEHALKGALLRCLIEGATGRGRCRLLTSDRSGELIECGRET